MKTSAILGMLFTAVVAQPQPPEGWNWTLPANVAVKQGEPRQYRVTYDYHYLDTKGNVARRERVSALYVRDLPGNRVRWSDVAIAPANGSAQKRDFMEDFHYTRDKLKDMLNPGFFQGFPPAAMLERNLVWDTHMMEGFGQDHFTDLKLNVPYHVPHGDSLPLAGAGTFELKDVQLVWTGLSRRNGQECAVIDYRAFLNTVSVKVPGIHLIAGSHFWGQVWVSLRTKQIEYGTLFEDVAGELHHEANPAPEPMKIFRMGVLEPVSNGNEHAH